MSALCQKQTFRAAERTSLFDHLVGEHLHLIGDVLPATRRWHDELATSAAALSYFRAIAKLQILGQAQPHFGQASAGATDSDRASRQTRIGFDESIFDILRRNADLAHRLEIGAWRLA
jgi:hypothetical protein